MTPPPPDTRGDARRRFLAAHGRDAQSAYTALPGDASARRYFRIAAHNGGNTPQLLMDVPPPGANLGAFAAVARHLERLGLRAPRVYAMDEAAGLALIEDFGDNTFTRLLTAGRDETALYRMAVDTLLHLHHHPGAATLALPPYNAAALLDEALLLMDWFYPEVHGAPPPRALRAEYGRLWLALLGELPPLPPTLVLRDFHVDNLMQVEGATPEQRCGLLDFQDAVSGSPAYDLMSLLEDARRDLAPELVAAMRRRYREARPDLDHGAFDLWFTTLAAQRHCKVIGIFTRLQRRDNKPGYLRHVPRVRALLNAALAAPRLAPLRSWLDARRLLAC